MIDFSSHVARACFYQNYKGLPGLHALYINRAFFIKASLRAQQFMFEITMIKSLDISIIHRFHVG